MRSWPSAVTSRAGAFRCCGRVCGHVMHTVGSSVLLSVSRQVTPSRWFCSDGAHGTVTLSPATGRPPSLCGIPCQLPWEQFHVLPRGCCRPARPPASWPGPFLLTLPRLGGWNPNWGSILVSTGTDRSHFVVTRGVMAARVLQGPCTGTRPSEPPTKAALTGPCWFLDVPERGHAALPGVWPMSAAVSPDWGCGVPNSVHSSVTLSARWSVRGVPCSRDSGCWGVPAGRVQARKAQGGRVFLLCHLVLCPAVSLSHAEFGSLHFPCAQP